MVVNKSIKTNQKLKSKPFFEKEDATCGAWEWECNTTRKGEIQIFQSNQNTWNSVETSVECCEYPDLLSSGLFSGTDGDSGGRVTWKVKPFE